MARDSSELRITLGLRRDIEYIHSLDSIPNFRDPGSLYHFSSYGLDSTPSPSHPTTIEDDVYASGHDKLPISEEDDDPKHDAEDIEESESIDVFDYDSDDKHDAYGFHQDLEIQQPFNDNIIATTEHADSRSNNAYSSLSYVPRGFAFFSDLGSTNDDDLTDESDLECIVTFSENNNNIRLHMRFESKQ